MILNHAPSAIADLLRLSAEIRHRMPQDATALKWLCGVIEKAEKFALPEGGRAIEDAASIARVYDCLRLPFPIVCMEYRATGHTGASETRAPKRIAVAFEWSAFLDSFGATFGQRDRLERELGDGQAKRIAVISLYCAEEIQHWVCVPHIGIMHTDEVPQSIRLTAADIASGEIRTSAQDPYSAAFHADRVSASKKSFAYRTTLVPLLPNAAAMLETSTGGSDGLRASMLDLADEMMAAASLAAITSCANVRQEVVPAPAALNKKRARSGKPALFDYRTLVLKTTDAGYEGSRRGPHQGGSHRSPAEHVRRGHVRRLDELRTTWVNSVVVNPGVSRAVSHGYVLKRSETGI